MKADEFHVLRLHLLFIIRKSRINKCSFFKFLGNILFSQNLVYSSKSKRKKENERDTKSNILKMRVNKNSTLDNVKAKQLRTAARECKDGRKMMTGFKPVRFAYVNLCVPISSYSIVSYPCRAYVDDMNCVFIE